MATGERYYNLTPFSGENFSAWAFRIKSILKENGIEDAIESEKYAKVEANKRSEAKAQAIIIAGVANSHLEYLKDKSSAYWMYKNLEDNFVKRSVRGQLFIRRKLSDIKFNESGSLLDHFIKLDELFGQLKDANAEITEEEKVSYILLSMPKTYEAVITALETLETLKVDFVKDRLLGEEEKKKKNIGRSHEVDNAFLCYGCGKPGHKKFQCRERRQSHQKQNNSYNSGYRRENRYQQRGRDRYQYRGRESNMTKDKGNDTVFMCERGEFEYRETNTANIEWCIDSGCTDHLVNCKDWFIDYIELKKPKQIAAAKNGVSLVATGIGNLRVYCMIGKKRQTCTITNVYFVPELRKNLLSVSKIEANGFQVVFSKGKVRIFRDQVLTMIGDKESNLYKVKTYYEGAESNYSATNKQDVVNLWHRRFGHLGIQNMKLLIQRKLVKGMSELEGKRIESTLCEQCLMGKMTRLPFNREGQRATKPLELVHTDVCGPFTPETWDGNRYFITFIDDFTHFVAVYLMKSKAEAVEKFKKYYYYATGHFDNNLKKLRSDNGREYLSNEFVRFCEEKGIKVQHTVPYNPEMNGVAERLNRTLLDKARTILIDANMDKKFWGEAVLYSTYVTNRSPVAGRAKTASELWEGKQPDVSNFKVFGCVGYNYIPKELRKKLDQRGSKMKMVGYSSSGYRLWDEINHKIVNARNVVFDERQNTKEIVYLPQSGDDISETETEIGEKDKEKPEKLARKIPKIIIECQEKSETEGEEINEPERSELRRSKRQCKRPQWFDEFAMDESYEDQDEALYALLGSTTETPKSYAEIKMRKDRKLWEAAIKEEIQVLEESETWKRVPKPEKVKLIECKWVFAKKEMKNKPVYKARLVVRGFQQEENFSQVYSPVLRLQTLRIILSVACSRNYLIHQMDVKGAFLYGRIDETVYLKPPEGVTVKDNHALKLTKSLYGLRKSPKYWYECFDETIRKYGFERSESDYCLYKHNELYLLLYVDDLLILGQNLKEIIRVKEFLSSKFRMKDMGSENLMYLGIAINKRGNSIVIDQSQYLKKVLEKFGMLNCKGCDTSMDCNFKMDKSYVLNENYEKECRSMIGSLMYATVGTRPDLATSVYYLSRFQSRPTKELWIAIRRIMKYVKHTLNYALVYESQSESVPLMGYADADWARDSDRKSTSGYLFKVYNNTVVWKSQKQATVALSTTEAEYISLCEAAAEACWIKKLLLEMKINVQEITIFEDNQSTIYSVKNPDQKRLKHIDIKFQFIKQLVEDKIINVTYVNTDKQIADVLTKPLNKKRFLFLVKNLSLRNVSNNEIEEEC